MLLFFSEVTTKLAIAVPSFKKGAELPRAQFFSLYLGTDRRMVPYAIPKIARC